jgi:putative membrane protein
MMGQHVGHTNWRGGHLTGSGFAFALRTSTIAGGIFPPTDQLNHSPLLEQIKMKCSLIQIATSLTVTGFLMQATLTWADEESDRKASATLARDASAAVRLSSEDRAFLTEAIQDNLKEVGFGELARIKSVKPDVRAFAEQMVKDHSQAVQKLTVLAASKGLVAPSSMSDTDQRALKNLAARSAAAFDQAYVADMIEDHKQDVAKFQKVSQQSRDPEIKRAATELLPTLQAHWKHVQTLGTAPKQ